MQVRTHPVEWGWFSGSRKRGKADQLTCAADESGSNERANENEAGYSGGQRPTFHSERFVVRLRTACISLLLLRNLNSSYGIVGVKVIERAGNPPAESMW